MSRHPIFVIADDLTGAAEIAAIAHNAGLRAVVRTKPPSRPIDADVIVCDTDTRLDDAATAARRVRSFVTQLKKSPNGGFFKKTDSVLRGPVLAELTACAEALNRRRTLLIPCNPSLGRVIRDGHYYIAGRPLHETTFVRDPHHPRTTSDVGLLLDPDQQAGVICSPPACRVPLTGLIVGEADSPADVTVWAGQVDKHTLPAGGADFFRVWLQSRRTYHPPKDDYRLPVGATLLINGTTATPEPFAPFPVDPVLFPAAQPPSARILAGQLRPRLALHGCAALNTEGPPLHDLRRSAALTRTLAGLVAQLHKEDAFRHLLITGGATAAAVLHKLGWAQFEVVCVWGPGVVTLRPAKAPRFAVTLKPGSYVWPASLNRYFLSANAA